VLGDIARVLPSGVSLTELSATTPQPTTPEPAPTTEDTASSSTPAPAAPPSAVPSTPTGVTVSGYTLDYSTVARTLARIQAVPSLTNAQLQSATPTVTAGKKRIIEFTIVADLATPGGAQ
jgi:Tfp pilus assembly protein PilN